MMAELAVGWHPASDDERVWQARMNRRPGGQLMLTVYDVLGLWHAAIESTDDGRWEFAPSPADTRETAQQWAEARAEQIAAEQ